MNSRDANLGADATAGLYWSRLPSRDIANDRLIKRIPLEKTAREEPYEVHVTAQELGIPAHWANYLLLVLDDGDWIDEEREYNNTDTLSVQSDLDLRSLEWHTGLGGGVTYSYEVKDFPIQIATTVALYWVKNGNFWDKQLATEIPLPDGGVGEHGPYDLLNHGWNDPPAGTTHLQMVMDPWDIGEGRPNGWVEESDENNNHEMKAVDLATLFDPYLHPQEGWIRPVEVKILPLSPPTVEAEFKPAGGALTLSQAAAIAGVHHFNWIQNLTHQPAHWRSEIWRNVRVRGDDPMLGASLDNLLFDFDDNGILRHVDPETGELGALIWRDPDDSVDPIIQLGFGPGYDITVILDDRTGQILAAVPQPWADQQVYYWDEGGEYLYPVGGYTRPFSLIFRDHPLFPRSALQGGHLEFETKLAGVKHDGSPVTWDGRDTNFRWKSDVVHEAGLLGYFYPGSGPYPAVTGGNIFAVAYGDDPLNHTPRLEPIASRTVQSGQGASFPVAGSDSDAGQSLTYSLDQPIGGVHIDPATGLFTWFPLPNEPPGSYTLTVRVTDNGTPSLSALQPFTVTVVPATGGGNPPGGGNGSPGQGGEQGGGQGAASGQATSVALQPKGRGKKKKLVARINFSAGLPPREVVSPFQKPAFQAIAAALQDRDGDGRMESLLFTARRGKKKVSRFVAL